MAGKRASGGARPCPMCGKPQAARYRPFCSRRCKHLDLGRWLDGRYRIPTEEAWEEGPEAPPEAAGERDDDEG